MKSYVKQYLEKEGYPAAGRRCLVDLDAVEAAVPTLQGQVEQNLMNLGYQILRPTLEDIANHLLENQPRYRRGAWMHEAPEVVDCSLLVGYILGEFGLFLGRTSDRMFNHSLSLEIPAKPPFKPLDVIFAQGPHPYPDGIGHAALALDEDRIIHASNEDKNGITVSVVSLSQLRSNEGQIIGARRYIHGARMLTVGTPSEWVDAADSSRDVVNDLFRSARGYPEVLETEGTVANV